MDELKDIVHWQSVSEGPRKWYYHLNITVKTKGATDEAGSASLFFAEVARDQNDVLGYYINTFFRVNTDSKGSLQYTLISNYAFGIPFEVSFYSVDII